MRNPLTYKHKALPNDHTKHHIPFLFPKAWHHSASLAAADVVPDLAEVSWAESAAVQGYRDVGQPAHDGGSHSSGTVEGTAAPTPAWSVPSLMLEGLAGQAASTGRRTGSCCCSCCRSAISVGEARWSGPLELPQCLQTAPLHCLPVPPDSSATLSQCLRTAPLHCLLVGCDSSTSSLARKRQLCRGAGWGVEGSRLEAWMKSHK